MFNDYEFPQWAGYYIAVRDALYDMSCDLFRAISSGLYSVGQRVSDFISSCHRAFVSLFYPRTVSRQVFPDEILHSFIKETAANPAALESLWSWKSAIEDSLPDIQNQQPHHFDMISEKSQHLYDGSDLVGDFIAKYGPQKNLLWGYKPSILETIPVARKAAMTFDQAYNQAGYATLYTAQIITDYVNRPR